MRPSVCGVCVCVALILSFIYPSAFMCLVSPCIFFFCKDISLMLSYHTHLLSLPFVSFSISLLLAWFFFIYLPVSLSLLKKKIPSFSLALRFFHGFLLFFSMCPRLRLLLSVSQSRIPGTVIPLCAAQCERIFNTTRIPGEETGKETEQHARVNSIHRNVWMWSLLHFQTS